MRRQYRLFDSRPGAPFNQPGSISNKKSTRTLFITSLKNNR
jgi:hypothetical protein